ncbi:MAG TPA: thioredoxin [Gammaproteobacteria bacterium]|nr:thioredoxin [Gammaproteobacteria bacterium]
MNATTFERDVLEASRHAPVVVDFWAPWCAPCRALGPVLDRVAQAFGGSIKLVKINVDENPALSQAFDIRSIPRVIAFKDGRAFAEFLGALPEAQVRDFFSSLTPSAGEAALRAAEAAVAAAADEPSEAELRETLTVDPLDHAARMQLANALARQRRYREAMDELIEVVRLGRHAQSMAARERLSFVFTLAANDAALVAEYGRKLASALA